MMADLVRLLLCLQSVSEQNAAHQQAAEAVQKELESQKAASKAAQDKLQEQVAALTEQCNRYCKTDCTTADRSLLHLL